MVGVAGFVKEGNSFLLIKSGYQNAVVPRAGFPR